MSEVITAVALREPAHRVSPRAKVVWIIHAILGAIFPLAGLGVWMWFDEARRSAQLWLLAVLLVWLLLDLTVMPWWRYRVHRWEYNDVAVYTRSGWVSQERRVAPVSRVQTVDLQRGPIQQALGLATVTVTTASAAGAVEIEQLDLATAEQIVADLTSVTARTPGDAT
ncbi:PH domain-containing protein [Arsenicicoccus piscis]|uniref:Membrane protein n=1 Tax=Arsenicicoccus piscis TaxID=673954 RepID=A0ABQ6HSE0_9MICO|nr:PH domain-containing protein [Arsenicicoccus piscis]MCH8628023.1 PH domain-containing protein [Arsenicicoccus piscis]GMA20624.1 membrane protein [Arsenicicoccus piscis]